MSTAAQDTDTPRAHCTVDADGRTTFRIALRSAGHPRLALVPRAKKNAPPQPTRLLDLEPHGDDGDLRAVLEPLPALAEGRWDAYLMRETDAVRERLRPGLRDLRALVDGNLRERPSPVAVRVPYATKDGFLAVRAWLRPAHAEAGRLDLADGAMTVHACLHGAELSDDATALLRLRGDRDTTRTFPLRTDGSGFSFTASFAELTGAAPGDQVWDVFLRPAADVPPVRIGRLLDDTADRKTVCVYPALTVGEAAARPYYTVDNDLAVEVTAVR
ncbi:MULTISPECIES: transferase [unclassified Streptomyces]|uniref:transferase n=1 Tax=unclassified Streptomyces TaxID=2593676 RepID=UPI0007ED6618|nr:MULTISPECIES: transferase [unclassified Streptomyces]MCP3768129.1 transferase [Streptomyces sp. MAR25Y5]OBQ46794.1 transferase [Streptomyces sp. H-KF8]